MGHRLEACVTLLWGTGHRLEACVTLSVGPLVRHRQAIPASQQSGTAILAVNATDHRLEACASFRPGPPLMVSKDKRLEYTSIRDIVCIHEAHKHRP